MYRLEFASSLTVAMTKRARGSAVRPSHLPLMSHCPSTRPAVLNSTTVLSVFPSALGSPCGPTPFWKPANRWPPSIVMSSGLDSGSVLRAADPDGVNVCVSLPPSRMTRTRNRGAWCEGRATAATAATAGPAPLTHATAAAAAVTS